MDPVQRHKGDELLDTKIMKSLHDILSTFGDKYLTGKELNKARIIHDIDRYDEELIMALLNNDLIKKHYAKKIGEYTIIETNKLIETFEMDDYWMDSYTKYTKKIGLTTNGRFLDESTDVVLDFPYKDTVLKAGMSKEDVAKEDLVPNEPFFNEVIAAEEVDTLLDKKILVNTKRYTANAVEEAHSFSEEDNLILKGNNLLALHSLKDRYAGKVKQIFIDPPYYFSDRKNDDTFGYNSNFKLSTWLTFLKNRLEVAKELLSEDGTVWISIDDGGSHYLKVLCDSIFDENNFIANVIWEKKFSPQNDATWLSDNHDHILAFAKNKEQWRPNLLPRNESMNSRYTNIDNDPRGPWTSGDLSVKTYNSNTDYTITTPSGRKVNPPSGYCWRVSKEKLREMIHDNRIWFGKEGNNVPRIKRFLSEVKDGVTATTIWKHSEVGHNQDAKREVNALDDVDSFNTPKPEKLIQRILHIGSNIDDIVLDFFMGSATTQAVAMKMNRRFIGIEQMDYINTVSVPRLQKVMEGEQGGISKEVVWQGGGSFVYAELMEKSKGYLQDVLYASNSDQLNTIYQLMLENVDLDFRADLESVQTMLKDTISLEDKKRLLIKVIDKNQLYYNYAEIDDTNVRELISDADYAFNQSFYEEGRDGQKDS